MPFGLKNTRVAYQRLVNKIFTQQIGRNIKVYIDDILVKCAREIDHLDDLREMFKALYLYFIKLNLSKCVFGIVLGKFLGFMVSQCGVEANPNKVRDILEMTPLKNTKEM